MNDTSLLGSQSDHYTATSTTAPAARRAIAAWLLGTALLCGQTAPAAAQTCTAGVSVEVREGDDAGSVDCYTVDTADDAIVVTRFPPLGARPRKVQVVTSRKSVPKAMHDAAIKDTRIVAVAGVNRLTVSDDRRTVYVAGANPLLVGVFWRDLRSGAIHFSASRRFRNSEARDAFFGTVVPRSEPMQ